jgi:exonuclease VII small subunit
MGKVKPMRVIAPRIIQPGDRTRVLLWVLIVVALGAWTWQVFEFGRQHAGFSVTQSNAREAELEERIAELEQEREALRAAAARFERAGQIDRAAADTVQAQVKTLQDERADLRREVAFLKSIVSGGDHTLALADEKLSTLGERSYRFEITLSKRSDKSGTVQGEVVFKVRGSMADDEKTLDMETLTEGRRSRIGIRFKNFQRLTADLKLPDGFEPAAIVVGVKPDGKGFKAFEQSYDWRISDA